MDNGNLQEPDVERSQGQDKRGRTDPYPCLVTREPSSAQSLTPYQPQYVTDSRAGTSSSLGAKFLAGTQGAFAIGRFSGVLLMRFIRPRWVFVFYLTMCIVFIGPAITQRNNTGMAMLYITLFFESICFPTIVALGMRGLGKYTKRGSGLIVGGVCGGAVVPPLLGATSDRYESTATAMLVPLLFFVAAWTYALAVNFVEAHRGPADKFSTAKIGIKGNEVDVEGTGQAMGEKAVVEDRESVHHDEIMRT